MKGFAELCRTNETIGQFIHSTDRFFGHGCSVQECAKMHAENWLSFKAAVLNIDRLIRHPRASVASLSALLGEPAVELNRPLPRKKGLGGGKLAELAVRLTGRESTNVDIRPKLVWKNEAERRYVDEEFCKVYSILDERKIN
jgi:hypothetical protein